MIERIEIRNFRANRCLDIDFSSGVTTIVGPSDVGKSAAMGAIRWVAENDWDGVSDISWGETECDVRLYVDGHCIRRRRTPSENLYYLDDQEFKAFGLDVPDPIKRLLNLDETNWQGQHDSHYWFSETAGEVSRQLNAVVDLGVIDSSLSSAASAMLEAKRTYEAARQRHLDCKARIDELGWVEKAQERLSEVQAAEKAHLAKADDAILSEDLLRHYRGHDEVATKTKQVAVALNAVALLGREAAAIAARRAGLAAAIADARRAAVAASQGAIAGAALLAVAKLGRDAHATANRRVDLAWTIGAAKKPLPPIPDTTGLEIAFDGYNEAKTKWAAMYSLLNSIELRNVEIDGINSVVAELEEQMGDVCPVCGGPLGVDLCKT